MNIFVDIANFLIQSKSSEAYLITNGASVKIVGTPGIQAIEEALIREAAALKSDCGVEKILSMDYSRGDLFDIHHSTTSSFNHHSAGLLNVNNNLVEFETSGICAGVFRIIFRKIDALKLNNLNLT